ncbi:hypothetical protein PS934_01433 [Pseudomonas fluorescens]|uniref:hypothetical protein n=1 Tax=Pseudomonas fluorescens TaxID=294 RepID=UPI0012422BFA|nr:hypothetical protein [Pseudomonas fluorescens]VVP89003.1 hypothetical protein PS934_01433 [Pseudomonas fluorescens]
MVSLVDKNQWAPLIGRLFISFGSIESLTHDCIRKWSSSIVYKYVKGMPLSRRIEFAIELLAEQSFPDKEKEAFKANLRKSKSLVEIRNIIAHSPLALVLFQEESDTPFREAIASNSDDSKIIEFEKLQKAVEQTEEIVERLHQHLASFRRFGLNLYPPADWQGLNHDS